MFLHEYQSETSKLLAEAARVFETRDARIRALKAAVAQIKALPIGPQPARCRVYVDDPVISDGLSMDVDAAALKPLIEAEIYLLEVAQVGLKDKMESAAEILHPEIRAA